MLKSRIEDILNKQVEHEMYSSNLYLAMSAWAESEGFAGVAEFMMKQATEERGHAEKIMRYIAERGGRVIIPAIAQPTKDWVALSSVFEQLLEHEVGVTEKINDIIAITLEERDYNTQNFLQWFISEQLEEEALARTILDKIKLIGDEPGGGLYMFDRDISSITVQTANEFLANG